MTIKTRARSLLLLLTLAVGACASAPDSPPGISVDYDHQFDFASDHSFYIEPFSRTDPATITVSDTQIRRINEAIRDELQRKGFKVVPQAEQADLLVSWYLYTEERVDKQTYDSPRYYDTGVSTPYSSGTLVVSMTNLLTNQPVWRAVLHTELRGDTDEYSEARRRAAAQALFAGFPPTAGAR